MAVPLHCLQIEDSESDAALVFRLLKKARFEVHGERVESASDLRSALARKHWDVIIGDYHLPGFDAYKALAILQESGLDIPFIGVSGKVGNEIAAEIMQRGAADYFTKDELERLVPAIKRELREADMRRSHKLAEATLKLERERFMATLRNLSEAVITTDEQGQIVSINPVAEQITGWSAHQTIGKAAKEVFQLIDAKTRDYCPDPVAKVLESARRYDSPEVILLDKHKCEQKIALSVMSLTEVNDQTVGSVIVFREIREEQRLDEGLRNSNRVRSIGIVASEIAHDFSNFLSIIMGNIELAMEYCRRKNLSKAMQRLDSTLKVFNKAKNLACQLIGVSQGGKPVLRTMPVGPVICREARKILRHTGIKVSHDFPDDQRLCRIDESQISLVFANIFSNASQILGNRGSISIDLMNLSADASDVPPQIKGPTVRIATSISCPDDKIELLPHDICDTLSNFSENSLDICSASSIINKHGGLLRIEPHSNGITYFIYLPAVDRHDNS